MDVRFQIPSGTTTSKNAAAATMSVPRNGNGDRDGGSAKVVCLRHQRESDDGARQDCQENRYSAQCFSIGQRARGQQTPVFGGKDLQPSWGSTVGCEGTNVGCHSAQDT